ncbi:MAG: 2-oxoglutarate dehydrogenase complex dihydrolipoyllysine-residue succinyltransferase [Bacteroidales bacterium]|nr:2-oxoglutarate dehydrogenase complex dihydrolipoyllysine-residue succinyltransferase [Bacteroidales bacterium]MBN2697586.1 2-oxoglutarate dehydrogenase complex dihydrolipoyllysine-residue succinyltransferase [Bacteroidales bacterium]
MNIELKIPSPGESITEVEMASWLVEDGAMVEKDQEVGEIESDKATLPLIAEKAGQIKILIQAGTTAKVGDTACIIDTSVTPAETDKKSERKEPPEGQGRPQPSSVEADKPDEPEAEAGKENGFPEVKITPVAREMMENEGLSVEDIIAGLRKITSRDVQAVMAGSSHQATGLFRSGSASRKEERVPISQLRKKISERLVNVKNETAMLTTFNEVDMSAVMNIRRLYQEQFMKKHGVKLGFMSFFTRAVTGSLGLFPKVNSFIDGGEIVTPEYCDIGIAVQTDKGLMVPVIRNTESMSMAEIEKQIAELAGKARKARLGIEEMSGGTFTITNGGIYGSMLSTPLLNPPQSAILGMHNIVERPVVVEGKIVIRPIMYLALSYDHRVVDGRDSVGFLKSIKNFIEDPGKMLFGGASQETVLLGL